MTEREYLLLCLAEECDEVGQRVMKALRFGLDEVQPGQSLNNADRIVQELQDLISVAVLLQDDGALTDVIPSEKVVAAKAARIDKFSDLSRNAGILPPRPGPKS